MASNNSFSICVLPGDGIGVEVMAPCIAILQRAIERTGGFELHFEQHRAGAFTFRDTGKALPDATLEAARDADAILLGAMGWPDIRYPDGTEIAPQLDPRAADIDFVLIRESTEGLFASRGKGIVIDDREARDTLVITRDVSERLFNFSFELARTRRGQGRPGLVTCVDKANVFTSFAFFRKIFDECAARNPDIAADRAYVDATALYMLKRPWTFDVLVTENMFGDILSDLAAGLCGGMGFAPSADIGDRHAVFQPCHGTAPDIAGQGKANPIAAILSGAMMVEWLGQRHACEEAVHAGRLVRNAVDAALTRGIRPFEVGGTDGTSAITRAVLEKL
jgi:3-isopropylmalate dehydrogenase